MTANIYAATWLRKRLLIFFERIRGSHNFNQGYICDNGLADPYKIVGRKFADAACGCKPEYAGADANPHAWHNTGPCVLCIATFRLHPSFYFFLGTFIFMVITFIITVGVEVPIDNQINTWTADTTPPTGKT